MKHPAKPILFSPPMVTALLAGTKTQTRRLVKPQPPEEYTEMSIGMGLFNPCLFDKDGEMYPGPDTFGAIADDGEWCLKSPYQPGDILWVRETFYAYGRWEKRHSEEKGRMEWHFVDLTLEDNDPFQFYLYAENPPNTVRKGRSYHTGWYKRPSLFMPYVAARLFLRVTDVRCERLQSISEADAIAEGVEQLSIGGNMPSKKWKNYLGRAYCCGANLNYPVESYRTLWDVINTDEGKRWEDSPWIFAYTFERCDKP